MKRTLTAFVAALLLAGCSSPEPTRGTDVPLADVCAESSKGKNIAVEGYLVLPDEFGADDSSVIIWLVDSPEHYDKPLAGVSVPSGEGPNHMRKPGDRYSLDDLDVTAADGTPIKHGDKVRVSGTMDNPLVPQTWHCRLDNPYFEKLK